MHFRLLPLAAVSALMLSASVASAEPDSFGIGDGHTGPKVITSADPATAGEVDSYAGITADVSPGDTSIAITTTVLGAAFRANDLVMLWRSTGVAASEDASGDQTTRLDLANALATTSGSSLSAGLVGRYELARVASVTGSTLTLTKPIVAGFTKNVSQVVRVPEFTTVNVGAGAALRALPWQEIGGDPANPNHNNPWAGGILVFFANGAIQNDGTIHANERGFHGGTPQARNVNSTGLLCDGTSLDGDPTATAGAFAPKGEGVIASKFSAQSGGKGNISNAGGGGDCFESGGGGGANYGNGGVGSSTILSSNAGGLGGVGIDYDVFARLTMGGGGGSGRHVIRVGLTPTSELSLGGYGGGVVYVRGASLAGAGVTQSNGGDGEGSGLLGLPAGVASEGSGGGGAGGTVLVRLTGALDCSALNSNGGNGGNATVLGATVLGAGGGGGGGRVFFQAASKTGTCAVTVTQGGAGNSGAGGAQNGGVGGTTGSTNPLCVATAPGIPGSCANPTPVCDPASGTCAACSGPFGGGGPDPCPVDVEPVCLSTGACVACDGDFNSGATQACELAVAPTCFATGTSAGSCGKCTTDADCAGHPGPRCDVSSGACGTACTKDADCKQTEWCAPTSATSTTGTCVPKVPNGQPLPAGPPIDGNCRPDNGQRTCLSAVCEESDDLCGKRNGDPCPGGAGECRSEICYTDQNCGLPNGEPCTGDGQCRSELCQNGFCVGKPCGADPDCPLGQVCDPTTSSCSDGCRPGLAPPSDGGLTTGDCTPPATCVGDGGPIGTCNAGDAGLGDGSAAGLGSLDGGDTAGLIEGGGCACSSTITSAGSPLAALGAAACALLLFRRRKNRRS